MFLIGKANLCVSVQSLDEGHFRSHERMLGSNIITPVKGKGHDGDDEDNEATGTIVEEDTLTAITVEFQGWINVLGSLFEPDEEPSSAPASNKKFRQDNTTGSSKTKLEKSTVLQAARLFHDSIAVKEHPGKCCQILANLLRLNEAKGGFSRVEATDVFFGTTKLFVSDDITVRRMVYLFLKEIYVYCDPNDVIIVTSCLTKDMASDVIIYKANALRVLARIIDSSMLGAMERYVKQSIVATNRSIATAALAAGHQLFERSPDCQAIIRKWIGETQEAIKRQPNIVQYHALLLIYQMKSHDRLAVSKIVAEYSRPGALQSPMALVLLIRFTAKLMMDEVASGRASGDRMQDESPICKQGYEFLNTSLMNRADMVALEAARYMCSLPLSQQEVDPAIQVLKLLLISDKPAAKLGAMRALAHVATRFPRAVSKCNTEFEALIDNKDLSISTLAVTTLIKTGNESSVDGLLDSVTTLMGTMEDEYRVQIIQRLQDLCFTYPTKHLSLVNFFSKFLMAKATFEFKRSIVVSIVALMQSSPETTEYSLHKLCDALENCEYIRLSTEILHVLAELGPTTQTPSQFVSSIYNRFLLGLPMIRAAAVSALTSFGAHCPRLRASVLSLLYRCLNEYDDETRDRVVIAISVLTLAMKANSCESLAEDEDCKSLMRPMDEPDLYDIAVNIYKPLPISFDKLARSLNAYKAKPHFATSADVPTFDTLPNVEDEVVPEDTSGESIAIDLVSMTRSAKLCDPGEAVYAIPELASFGRIFRSCAQVALTENEAEYSVRCTKHIYLDHVILQFQVENTVDNQRLENVRMALTMDEHNYYEAVGEIAAVSIPYGATQSCFTVLRRDTDAPLLPSCFVCELHFNVELIDRETGENIGDSYEEEYAVEDLLINVSDYMAKVAVADFGSSWDTLGADNEILQKFEMQYKDKSDAIPAIIGTLGMQPCDGTAIVKANSKAHMLHLSGMLVGGRPVLARARVETCHNGILLKMLVRSEDETASQIVLNYIQ
jgi:coatomer subunit gamma